MGVNIYEDNLSAIHIYKKLGFIESGVITRELPIKGRFYDSILMGYTLD